MMRVVTCVLSGLALAVMPAVAAVPHMVNYQGYLTDTDGEALDTTVAMTFSFYDDANMGTQLWTEGQASVTVQEGLFNVLLGSVNAIPDSAFAGTNVWLGITVGGDSEMSPRTRVASVAYSYRVGTVDGATGGTINGKLNVGTNNTNTGDNAFVMGNQCVASGNSATVGGGYSNTASGGVATVSGGHDNTASGLSSIVVGGAGNVASGTAATVGGYNNAASGYAATVGGCNNAASGYAATVGGGRHNSARGDYSFVGGGGGSSAVDSNSASGTASTISGGYHNTASGGYYATVGGGDYNTASGFASTVSGGYDNDATGSYSFAAGRRAKANHEGCFVWGDSYNGDIASSANNQFRVRASGGTTFYSNTALTAGAYLAPGANAWVAASDSTKKRNIRLVDTKTILDRVARLPIKQWSYKSQDASTEHIGPMAQDFYNLFHLGEDSLAISTIDPDGIALAAIQELHHTLQRLEEKTDEIEELRAENEAMRARLDMLETLVQNLLASRGQDVYSHTTFSD